MKYFIIYRNAIYCFVLFFFNCPSIFSTFRVKQSTMHDFGLQEKLEDLQKTHTSAGRTCKFHTKNNL